MSENDRTTGLVGYSGVKIPVRAASTAALTLSGEQTVDGVALVTDDRVLVKDQASSVDNGVYVVDTGSWSRSKDADGSYDWVQGSLIFVYGGTSNGNKIFKCTTASPVDVDTDDLTFTALSYEFTGSSRVIWCGTATGTANALVLTPSNALAAADLNAGLSLLFKSSASGNSGATTIAVSGQAAIAVQSHGAACVGGEIEASQWYRATLDASSVFQLERIAPEVLLTGDNLGGGINEKISTVASATTPTIFATTVGNVINYTGTTTCTGFTAAPQAGARRTLVCAAAAVFTAGANMLIDGVASGSNLTCAANDIVSVVAVTTTQFRLSRIPYAVAIGKQPTRQVLTSGTGATYTTPAGATRINVRMVGGGGGGSAATTNGGGNGNNTTFSTLTANGGGGGTAAGLSGGAGGAASGGDINIKGNAGHAPAGNTLASAAGSDAGGSGGGSVFGGGGTASTAGGTNSGGGGGGGSGNATTGGAGGGAGGYVEKLIVAPSATYTYTVGTGGAGGTAGTTAGGDGAAGIIIVDEYYN